MLLLIDNYDSFTYNLFQYLSELGAEVKVVRNDKITLEGIEPLVSGQAIENGTIRLSLGKGEAVSILPH